MKPGGELVLLVAVTTILCVVTADGVTLDRYLPACYNGIQRSGGFFIAIAFIARLLQILTAQRSGNCSFGNITIPEASYIPEPSGICGIVQCGRSVDGNLTVNYVTCSSIAIERDFERENKIYPFCCPYPEIEGNDQDS